MALSDIQPASADANTYALWNLDESSATTTWDNSEGDSGWDATPASGSEPAVSTNVPNGNYTRSRVFDHNDYASFSSPSEFQSHSGSFTLETMIYLADNDPTDTECFLGTYGTTTANRKFWFQRLAGGDKDKLQFGVYYGNSASYTVSTLEALTRGTWHYVAAVFSAGSYMAIYVDGQLAGYQTSSVPPSMDTDATTFCIGRYNTSWGGANAFDGLLTDIRVSSIARSEAEIVNRWVGDSSAIQLDATSYNSGTSTSVTWGHTCTGTDRILFVGFATGGSPTSVTYNGTSMTLVASNTTGQDTYLYMLVNPDTGSNTIAVNLSGSSWVYAAAASYTGVEQSNQPDGIDDSYGAGATLTSTVTTTDDNCWGVLVNRSASSGIATANSGCGLRVPFPGYVQLFDSVGPITPAGSTSFVTNTSGAGVATHAMATFSPAAAAPASTFVPRITFY